MIAFTNAIDALNSDPPGTSHVIASAASAVEPRGGRVDGLAPMTSCTLWKPPCGPSLLLLTTGYERVPITMMAQGMVFALKAIMDQHGDDARVVCLTETDEVFNIASERVQQAASSGQLTIDGLPTWYDLNGIAKFSEIVHRAPQTAREGFWVAECWRKARVLRAEALADFEIKRQRGGDLLLLLMPGITWSEWVPAPARFRTD